MSHSHSFWNRAVTALTLASFFVSPITPILAQTQTQAPPQTQKPPVPTPTTGKPPATTPATAKPAAVTQTTAKPATAAPAPPPPDGGWPRARTTPSGAALVMYQPQVASWVDQKQAVLYAAVQYTPKGARDATLGTLRVESATSVALDERLVSFRDLKISEANFPKLQRDQVTALVKEITDTIDLDDRVIGLDRVLASIDASKIQPKNAEGIKADPPPVFFSKTPAALVNIDGDPIWSPIPQNDLQSAVNTNWDLFLHTPTKTLYIRDNKIWMKATDVKGPWTPAGTLPESFKKLPDDDNWKEVKESLPGKKVSPADAPKVFVSLVPAEMILLKGEPAYAAITGVKQLLWVSNTDSDVFRMGKTGAVYLLVSGRWFSAPDFTGPWTFATPNLPEDFKGIPLEHERSRVLASVPGTTQAAEAVLLAQVPQTARVSKALAAPEVTYHGGKPEFRPIETTKVERAVNTDKDVLKVGNLYYLCYQGVWFRSENPAGPWTVTGDVPAEIYKIPASSPSYSVTYVTVEESSDDAVVYATALAFTGMMVAWGCVVWGTGYRYPPYIGYGGMYPIYYPHYPSYGFGASYNPWTGAYTRGAVAYGPYGGAGVAQRYNPRTGTYSRGAAAYGPYGSRAAATAYNPRTGAVGSTRQGSNVYGSWGNTNVARGDQWASTSRYTNRATGTTTRATQTSEGGAAITRNAPGAGNNAGIARTAGGDVYAGKDGNVYRKEGDSWQQYGEGGWSDAEKPTPSKTGENRAGQTKAGTTSSKWDPDTRSQVTRDAEARSSGTERTKELGVAQRSAAPRSSGSYRPSGGGARGGRGR